jgi:hypothetical protein
VPGKRVSIFFSRKLVMTAVPSNADVKKASLEAFTHALGMSAFV